MAHKGAPKMFGPSEATESAKKDLSVDMANVAEE